MSTPLRNIKVIDMGTFITGSAAAVLLGDLGADVVKVEQPETGDPFRAYQGDYYSPHFQTYNRNKRSITLNTKVEADLAAFDCLIADADVFIQNFRPGVAERLNVGAERLRAINPKLIYASISGFGSGGPDSGRPAFDTVAQAASGFLRLLVNPEHPRVVGPALADAVTGYYAAIGVLAALHERGDTGVGRLVETSMFEAMCHFNMDDFTHYLSADQVMTPYSRPHVSQSYVFACADGKWIALHMSSPTKFWENLALAVEQPDMLARPEFSDRYARIENYEQVVSFLGSIFLTKPRDEWCARLTELEVPNSAVLNPPEVLASAQAEHLGLLVESNGPRGLFRTIRSPLSFDGKRATTVLPPPEIGQHNAEILSHAHDEPATGAV